MRTRELVFVLSALGTTSGCSKPLAGKYSGIAAEHVSIDGPTAGNANRDVTQEVLTLEDKGSGAFVVQYGPCALPATKTSESAVSVQPGSTCNVAIPGFSGRVMIGGTVSRSGDTLSALLTGNCESPHASYSYQFTGAPR